MVCALVRLGMWGAVDVLETVPSKVLDSEFLAREARSVRHAPRPPVVLLVGSSRTQSGFVPEQMERELGLPAGSVGKVTAAAGTAWDALVLLRRNPALLDTTQLVVLDVEPWQLNDHYDYAMPSRFFWSATLRERWLVGGPGRFGAVADWFWPYIAQRRDLARWIAGLRNPLKHHDRLPPPDLFGPVDEEHYWQLHADPARRQAVRAEPRLTPAGFAQRALGDFTPSRRLEAAFRDLIALLKEHQIPLLLHQPPMHSGVFAWLRAHPSARSAYEDYANFLESLRAPLVGIAFWELTGEVGLTDDDLLDYGHFGRHAAEVYTMMVGQVIQSEGLLTARAEAKRGWARVRYHVRDVPRLQRDGGLFGRSGPSALPGPPRWRWRAVAATNGAKGP
jgi:hypothetical protein